MVQVHSGPPAPTETLRVEGLPAKRAPHRSTDSVRFRLLENTRNRVPPSADVKRSHSQLTITLVLD